VAEAPARRPIVTVCVPTIGRAVTLKRTLDSLTKQEFADYEVLILDNASGPEAEDDIRTYAAEDHRASVLRSPVRLPMFDNFQRGVDAASGRYLTFFHDDDFYGEDFLAEQVRFLEAHPSVAFAGSNWRVMDADGRNVAERSLIRRTEAWSGWRYIAALFALGSNLLPMPGIVFRRDTLSRQTFDASKGAHFSDFVLLMRLAENHDVGLIARKLITLSVHPDQASLQLEIAESLRLRTAIFSEYCDELAVRWPERKPFIDRLRRSIRSARRSSAVWTWLNANDSRVAAASRGALSNSGADLWVRQTLELADRLGIGRLLRTQTVRSRVRSAVYFVAARGK
jgi:glycosyltransferase involved in cell wall biosynthesis